MITGHMTLGSQWQRTPFDTVCLVIWPGNILPEMTYNVLSGTLSLYTITTMAKT